MPLALSNRDRQIQESGRPGYDHSDPVYKNFRWNWNSHVVGVVAPCAIQVLYGGFESGGERAGGQDSRGAGSLWWWIVRERCKPIDWSSFNERFGERKWSSEN